MHIHIWGVDISKSGYILLLSKTNMLQISLIGVDNMVFHLTILLTYSCFKGIC